VDVDVEMEEEDDDKEDKEGKEGKDEKIFELDGFNIFCFLIVFHKKRIQSFFRKISSYMNN